MLKALLRHDHIGLWSVRSSPGITSPILRPRKETTASTSDVRNGFVRSKSPKPSASAQENRRIPPGRTRRLAGAVWPEDHGVVREDISPALYDEVHP